MEKTCRIELRLSKEEKERLERAAKERGITVSEYIRKRCLIELMAKK